MSGQSTYPASVCGVGSVLAALRERRREGWKSDERVEEECAELHFVGGYVKRVLRVEGEGYGVGGRSTTKDGADERTDDFLRAKS